MPYLAVDAKAELAPDLVTLRPNLAGSQRQNFGWSSAADRYIPATPRVPGPRRA
jgi:hypothetical protein